MHNIYIYNQIHISVSIYVYNKAKVSNNKGEGGKNISAAFKGLLFLPNAAHQVCFCVVFSTLMDSLSIYTYIMYMNIYTSTHTHTHTHIYKHANIYNNIHVLCASEYEYIYNT